MIRQISKKTFNDIDIFVKKKEKSDEKNESPTKSTNIILKKDILKSIPENYLSKPDKELEKYMTETRWRFFKIPGYKNEVVEMSYKHPKEKRKYINNKGDWVESSLDNSFDLFLISEYYVYDKVE